jgi:hypothetical protein
MSRKFSSGGFSFMSAGVAAVSSPPFTIAGWVNQGPGSGTALQNVFSIALSTDPTKHYWRLNLETSGGNKVVSMAARGGNNPEQSANTSTFWTQNTWHHVCGVEASATDRRVFLNGGGKGTNTTSRSPSSVDRTHMASIQGGDLYYEGLLAHFGLWNVALTDDEILSLANGVSPLRLRRSALIGCWHLGGQSPDTDLMGNVNLSPSFSPTRGEDPPVPHVVRAPGGV